MMSRSTKHSSTETLRTKERKKKMNKNFQRKIIKKKSGKHEKKRKLCLG
jgi:hypothetical protein